MQRAGGMEFEAFEKIVDRYHGKGLEIVRDDDEEVSYEFKAVGIMGAGLVHILESTKTQEDYLESLQLLQSFDRALRIVINEFESKLISE